MNVSYNGVVDALCNKLLDSGKDENSTLIRLIIEPSKLIDIVRRDGNETFEVIDDEGIHYLLTFKITPISPLEKSVRVLLTNLNTKAMYLVISSKVFFNAVLNEYMKIIFAEKLNYMMEFDFVEATINEEVLPDEFDEEEDLDE